ncbi:type II CRISPR RNA-guided endonuclease Cas9 [Companilactobacillus baiquanensis]|uniref:CRISPR-associated endonuclease Cas9 n=1 Tax=Companilactobacillus baiquanensis TaxID=2486005 RepID=A0ABW1UWP5_9LACO|nr:type II CRISPR RNA-guided endonuclease Cas9 [Companilactobacillus baiquanensis]
MNRKETVYNIGLDIGTNSVGWAISDDNYNLLKAKKMNLWGARKFEEAETAEDRRLNRSARRRYRRRRNRLNWLDEIFSDALFQKDPGFLNRMKHSWVSKKDTDRERDPYNLFIDKDFNDKDYFNKYPTIFHLRKELIENKEQADIRLVYLAIHNILKYRGNFTYEHQNFDVSQMGKGLESSLKEFNSALSILGISLPGETNLKTISTTLLKRDWSPSSKVKNIINQIDTTLLSKNISKIIFNLLVGLKVDLVKLFNLEISEKLELQFSSPKAESEMADCADVLNDEQMEIIDSANAIYSAITLKDILGDNTYISFAKVDTYKNHHEDLIKLKNILLKVEDKQLVSSIKDSYSKYIKPGKYVKPGKYKVDDFYKDLKKYLPKIDDPIAKEALQKIESGNYLLKQRTRDNGTIPYQLNEMELTKIIDNQSIYYPFLKENKDKILSLINFRIPYYVGPLNIKNQNNKINDFSWMVRKEPGAIRPWNFDEKVDREKSSNNFIRRMTATDTFLIGEPVLPKNSLIYQKYEVLSELNNIRIIDDPDSIQKGNRLTTEMKQSIYNELFKKYITVTSKRLVDWLIKESHYTSPAITGLANKTKFLSSLSTYHKFVAIFGKSFVDERKNLNQLEELVEWQTVFEDRDILKLKLQNSKHNYSDNQISKLVQTRYQGWGRLSKKLLTNFVTSEKIGNEHQPTDHSILDLMWLTRSNFMEIINSDKYNFEEQIKEFNINENDEKSQLDMVKELHGSPALKRSIWQSLIIVKELVTFMKHNPKNIFIEFTREDEKSVLSKSRYNQLNKRYKKIKNIAANLEPNLKDSLYPTKDFENLMKEYKAELSNTRLMLYFLQMGKSLYSNNEIDINKLFTTDYQIDHILPQSYIKDNSLENMALVKASENQRKANDLLLESDIINKNINRWQYLKKSGLIGPKKFANLTRTEITEEQKKGFIKRQLVQTSQMIKNVANIIDKVYPDTKVIETRANLGSEFRRTFSNLNKETYHFEHPEFVKYRDINDNHHAQDAYIATIVGTYQLKKYPKDNMRLTYGEYSKFFEDLKKKTRKKNGKIPYYSQNGFVIGSMFNGKNQVNKESGEIIWDQSIKDKISKTFKYRQFNITKRNETKDGVLFNQTITNHNGKKLIPRKKDLDPHIYGGYTGDTTSYISLVEIDGKNKLITIPTRIGNEIEKNRIDLKKWISDNTKHKKDIQIILKKIPVGQLIYSKENGYLSLKSATEIVNAQQLMLPFEETALLSLLASSSPDNYRFILNEYNSDYLPNIYTHILSKMKEFYPFYKSEYKRLADNIDAFKELDSKAQIKTLLELVKFLHADSRNADLNFGSIKTDRFGRKSNGIKISSTYIIHESPTGLYKTSIHID